jgi:diguanylate cyclase (GGDEF)-like protein/PAS domain S-box-containing protein
MVLSRRVDDQNGAFAGAVVATIDTDYWSDIYKSSQLGDNSAIVLLRTDGTVLARWPATSTRDISSSALFRIRLRQSPVGFFQNVSLFDGLTKYVGYERIRDYPIVISIALSEDQILADWRHDLVSDLFVALALLGAVVAMATALSVQFNSRLKAERALRERERRYRLLADNIADIIILLDRDGTIRFVSQSILPVMGRRGEDMIGRSCFDLIHPDDAVALRQAGAGLAGAQASRTASFRSYRADGAEIWIEANFKRAARSSDGPGQIVGVLRDVTERKRMADELTALNARLGELATIDSLTGLANRRTFDGFLRHEFRICERISVILFDIDHFKGYNDSFGHQAGDRCLASVARVIAEATELTKGISARYGGEEFVIVLPGLPEEMGFIVAEAVRLKVRALEIEHPACSGGFLTVSAGVASKSATTPTDAALLGEADRALYEAKRQGRDRTVRAGVAAPHLQLAATGS